jgi:hypothetical protein
MLTKFFYQWWYVNILRVEHTRRIYSIDAIHQVSHAPTPPRELTRPFNAALFNDLFCSRDSPMTKRMIRTSLSSPTVTRLDVLHQVLRDSWAPV